MDSIWVQNYPPDVPAEVDPYPQPSLAHLVEESCRKFGKRPAFANLGRSMSYSELDSDSRAMGAYLQQELGLRKGERVALMLPNVLQYPVALCGALRAGLVVVNVNPLYTAHELRHQLADSGARAIIVLESCGATLAETLADTEVEHVIVTGLGDLLGPVRSVLVNFAVRRIKRMVPQFHVPGARRFRDALTAGRHMTLEPVDLGVDDLALLQYTGGTTGLAKGAMLTHGNLLANLAQLSSWTRSRVEEGREIVITALPLYHIFSLTVNCLSFVNVGGLNVLITDPRDMRGFVTELRKWRFTVITGVNTLFQGLLHTPGFAELDFSALKFSIGGGAAIQRAVAERWREVTGCHILEGYGLTEASPVVSGSLPTLSAFDGTVGLPYPSTDISVRDDQGRELAPGEPGELHVRGPQVMRGYWGREDATREAFSEDGYFKTGDIATVDEGGFLRIVDRKKDMILVSGFNVYPNEVEDVVVGCPGVSEAACVGFADERTGEAVKVFVVTDPGAECDSDRIRAHCKQFLAAYKVPRQVEFRSELPKSNVGKILRRMLK